MKVYVLSHGEYSDWTIDGIFSSLEALEIGKAKLKEEGLNTFNNPDEHELDELVSLERGPTWSITIDCKTGRLEPRSAMYDPRLRHPQKCIIQVWNNWQKEWNLNVRSPVSGEHAKKVAIEKRQEWLRIHAQNPHAYSESVEV